MKTKLPNEFLAIISKNNGLKQYLSNLLVGREFTPRSWLYEDVKNADDILDMWMSKLNRLQDGDRFEKEVFQFDTSQIEKWGPQGGIAPIGELLDSIVEPTFEEHSPAPAFATREWETALKQTVDDFHAVGIRALRPASYRKVVDDMRARDTLESNSGWPLFTRRNKPEVISESIRDAENEECYRYPAIALFRNYNKKTRLVWMFPMSLNLVEGSYFQPLQSQIIMRNLQFFSPWVGFDAVRKDITAAYDSGLYIAASDFSATDEHFRLQSTMQVYSVLKHLFQQSSSIGLEKSLDYMHRIPLIVGPDEMLTGEHGVSSGSNWTNFVETVFDQIFANYVHERNENALGMYAIGDDMSWLCTQYDEGFAEELEHLGKSVGQEVKAEKTTNKPDQVKTLQRLFQRGYRRQDGQLRGVYSTVRALKSSVYPERFHKPSTWNSNMFCARQYMILENCVDHPLFEDFVKFVVHGQKDLLPFARKSAAELTKITRETKLLPGFNPTYNQEKRDTSLAEFESVKIARSL